MRLTDFIDANVEPILAEWEVFARNIWPNIPEDSAVDRAPLRNDAETILRAAVSDRPPPQTAQQQTKKSKGERDEQDRSAGEIKAGEAHNPTSSRLNPGHLS